MKITANKQQTLSQKVNSIGKYLFKNLSGAYDFKKSSNMFDVYTIILYQFPHDVAKKYGLTEEKYLDVHEMTLNINITTYGDKIRVNIIELTPEEVTLGFKAYSLTKYPTYKELKEAIEWFVQDRLFNRYSDYDFLF